MKSTTNRRQPSDVSEEAPDGASSIREAMVAAGKILARRAHSEHEVRTKLASGFEPEVVDEVIERLTDLNLVDDAAFAEQWVSERSDRRGPLVLLAELEEKGVASEVAEAAAKLAGDQLAAATDLAHRQLRRVSHKPLASQVASIRGALLRRGFDMEVVDQASRAVLPPEGWD